MIAKSSTATYNIWVLMRRRCDKPTDAAYNNYGGRGITYCPEWAAFDNFLRDMGWRPAGMCLDRIDNNRGYYKENCRWASKKANNRNQRSTKLSVVEPSYFYYVFY